MNVINYMNKLENCSEIFRATFDLDLESYHFDKSSWESRAFFYPMKKEIIKNLNQALMLSVLKKKNILYYCQRKNLTASKINLKKSIMKNKILGLRTTIYRVGDMKAAKEWYSKAFETEAYFDEPFYAGFEIGGYELGLQPEETPATDKTESGVAYWGVEDVEQEFKRFVSLGAKEHEKPEEVGGGIIVAKIKDPWGNSIGLIYNPHFKIPA